MQNPIEYLKGVGPIRGDLLKKEANIFTFQDLLEYFPFRHIDRTKVTNIKDLNDQQDYVQIRGKIIAIEKHGEHRGKRLVVTIRDGTDEMDLVWFQGINWVEKSLNYGAEYLVYGRLSFFLNRPQISHPEIEIIGENQPVKDFLEPVYASTEKLKSRQLGGRQISHLTWTLLGLIKPTDIPENLPENILEKFKLMGRWDAFQKIHFPKSILEYEQAVRRLKFEELFLAQLRTGLLKLKRHKNSRGFVFDKVGNYFNDFYNHHLQFELTGAQKKVMKEIRKDLGSGKQMNRLLQGDVGSGKTLVAVMVMLLAIDNGFQSCFMAPTEILARQHFQTLSEMLEGISVKIAVLTGSTPAKEKKKILEACASGELQIIIGTHALIEETVKFKNLGLAIVDEQHRFGVAQRSKLWLKNKISPHILVMTATPIPRTLALTVYGDLDVSIMDEMPVGRKPINTVHRFDFKRSEVMNFIKSEIKKGRQAYIIYPLIEESAKLDFENLMKGYEEVKAYFPEPKYYISMVHGKQSAKEKEVNMHRFATNDTQILVSTTVVEVGVNVPNASVMVIESAEKFGLTQLHQLRGRVGRGSDQSYCVLISKVKLSADAKERIKIMCATNDGFKIAEKDLEIRGPGDIEGTRQSGLLNFKLASLIEDKNILEAAKFVADEIINDDSALEKPENAGLKQYLSIKKGKTVWSKIS